MMALDDLEKEPDETLIQAGHKLVDFWRLFPYVQEQKIFSKVWLDVSVDEVSLSTIINEKRFGVDCKFCINLTALYDQTAEYSYSKLFRDVNAEIQVHLRDNGIIESAIIKPEDAVNRLDYN